jgi:hypothetical protein
VPEPLAEADLREGLRGPLTAFGGRDSERDERRLDVLLRGERRNQVEGLEDVAEVLRAQLRQLDFTHLRQLLAIELERAAGRPVQAAEQLQQRRLAVTGRTLDREHVVVRDLHVHALESMDLLALALAVVNLRHTADLIHLSKSLSRRPC